MIPRSSPWDQKQGSYGSFVTFDLHNFRSPIKTMHWLIKRCDQIYSTCCKRAHYTKKNENTLSPSPPHKRACCRQTGDGNGILRALLQACDSIELSQIHIFYNLIIKETYYHSLKEYPTYLPQKCRWFKWPENWWKFQRWFRFFESCFPQWILYVTNG